ncbi:hypothetical protein [uncultured Tenacibaculum sp.]|uniref:hypothetical protein n=1 Tax=uncultured Tenacibaculum sp. TaxID=174713 RepID=UPI00262E4667|nr:hypothetical protein [uncultured Tenacibaculum sp.]
MKKENLESHKFLPSGEWEGFYCYSHSPAQHKMFIELSFKKGKIFGSGTDDINYFSWKGEYSLDTFKISMVKTYPSHTVDYNGDVDENGIWGRWNIGANFSGGFHIWPKKQNSEEESEALEESVKESKKLKKLFVEKIGG